MTARLLLGPMLRHVDGTSATIWMETSEPCRVRVLEADTTTFTVEGHHYALAIVTGLLPGTTTEYRVVLDGVQAWPPPDHSFPPSVIRTARAADGPLHVLFGSCRAAAPHIPPYTLEPGADPRSRGVDAIRANGLRMVHQDPAEWPDLLILDGDQVYADDVSVATERRVQSRVGGVHEDVPRHVVADFEEYTWLYTESWSPDVERWVFSVVPTMMIFDDHDVIDDWNISIAWVNETRATDWWADHIIGAMMSYWIYQHLGNLTPDQIASEGLLAALLDDGQHDPLHAWAFDVETSTPLPGGYRFSTRRMIGGVNVVVIDCRNGRELDVGHRRMIGETEWDWVVDTCSEPCDHLVLVTSLPVFTPGGIHAIQQWDEAICDGVWGRPMAWVGEKMRRASDMEDWAAFDRSFRAFEELLLSRGAAGAEPPPPSTISILSGDIHFAYAIDIRARDGTDLVSHVHQLVSSPIRHVLRASERRALEFAESRVGRRMAEFLQHRVGRAPSRLRWELDDAAVFANTMGVLEFDGRRAELRLERAVLDVAGRERMELVDRLDLSGR